MLSSVSCVNLVSPYLLILFTYLSSSDYWSLVPCLCYLEKQTLKFWITCKWLLRTYIAHVRPHHLTANIPNVCSRCFEGERHSHSLLECQQTQNLWKDARKCLSQYFNTRVPKSVFSQDFLRWNRLYSCQKIYCSVLDAPSVTLWIRELSGCIGLT